MVCPEVPLAVCVHQLNLIVVTDALIPAKNSALTTRGRNIGLVIYGKRSLILLGVLVTYYFSSGELELRQNLARHKAEYCTNMTPQTDAAT